MSDIENFSLDNLILAIKLFSNRREEDKEKFKEAEVFLKKVEKSKTIWVKSHELLMSENLDTSVLYFLFFLNQIIYIYV